MAVSQFPPASAGASFEFDGLTTPSANTYYSFTKSYPAGTYRFRVDVPGSYRVIFYNGTTIVATFGPLSANTSFTVPSAATILRFTSTVAGGAFSLSSAPVSGVATANLSITTITTSGSVTLNNSALVVALGGGGGGGNGQNSAGSGYLAQGILGPGTYNVTIGAGGGSDSTGGTTSIGNISAAGGQTNMVGGTSGSASNADVGFADGQGPFGSGVRISESLVAPGISWQTTGSPKGTPAGVYAGGGGTNAGGISASGYGGGGSGSVYGNNNINRPGGSGFQGVVWIGQLA